MSALPWLALALAAVVLVAGGLRAHGGRRWAASTRALLQALETHRMGARRQGPTHYDARELEGLPAPVQRYFRAVLREGQPVITAATIDLAGRFNLSATGEQWKAFTSQQRVVTQRPGFVWNAQIALAPGLPVRVVDSYIAGQGLLHAAMLGLFTVANTRGGGEIARGEFMRWLAEVAWYPTALLPSQGVQWAAVAEHSAHATLTDGPITLTLLFRFNAAGLIGSFRAEARGGLVGQQMVMMPWEGTWSDYQQRDGMQVPLSGEVAWMRPEGRKSYFVGSVTALAYEFAVAAPA